MNENLENFERACRGGTSGCLITCDCGVVYFDNHNEGYDWEEGELKSLQEKSKDPNSKVVACDYAPSDIAFEGKQYVDACACWHPRAEKLIGFIDGHARAIARYLQLEKVRKQAIADAAPVVD